MRNYLLKGMVICLLTLVLCFGFVSLASAEVNFYVGVSDVQRNSIIMDETYYTNYDETIVVPSLNTGDGFAVNCGIEFPAGCLEFDLTSTSHSGDYRGDSLSATYSALDINFKKFIGSSKRIRPYFLIGLSVDTLLIDDGAQDGYTFEYDDAVFTGTGINLGMGLDLKFNRHMSVKGEVLYRMISYTSVEGIYADYSLTDPLYSDSLSYSAGINIYF
jgi:hypothetical protein